MRVRKRLRDFNDLAPTLLRAKVNRRANCRRAHVVRFLHGPKHDLVKFVGICQQLIVIDLHQERNFVRIFPRHSSQNAKSGSHRVTAALDCKSDDVFGVKVIWVFRETRACRMFDALVHR